MYSHPHNIKVFGQIFNVLDKKESAASYELIRNTTMNYSKTAKVIVALMGGDGSIMRAIEILQPQVDIGQIQFVAMPFGSGNDMAQCLKFGETTNLKFYKNIRLIVREIVLNCQPTKVNIWEVIMTFNKKGDIFMIDGSLREKTILPRAERKKIKKGLYTHKGFMLNYFSMGDCAKIGYEFE